MEKTIWICSLSGPIEKSKTCDERSRIIQNRKWLGLSVIAFALVVAGAVVQAQQPEKIRRIGFLSTGVPGSSRGIEPFKRELRQLGYIEGKNIAFEYRYADGKPARLTALADELVRLNIDVIVAGGGGDAGD
jgi:putative ABC transport system substrate-binding protein